jgi:CheY-like chemotaxis protein
MNERRILVADDDFSLLLLLEIVLRNEGYEVDSCGNGEDALFLFDPARHGLLFLDYRMPRMTGLEVIRRLREAGHPVPAILASADMTPELSAEAEALGNVKALLKPLQRGELRAALQSLERRPPPGPGSACSPGSR